MRTITIKVYEYNELTDKAKARARDWYLEGVFDYGWWENIYEDAANVGIKITSFDSYHAEGSIITSAPEVIEDIRANHGKTCNTYKIATIHEPIFQELEASRDKDDETFEDRFIVAEANFLREILAAYHKILDDEENYMQSNEYLEAGILGNEYEFDVSGGNV
jgi:hypothetical protein